MNSCAISFATCTSFRSVSNSKQKVSVTYTSLQVSSEEAIKNDRLRLMEMQRAEELQVNRENAMKLNMVRTPLEYSQVRMSNTQNTQVTFLIYPVFLSPLLSFY